MLHGHVETLLYHGVFVRDISTGSYLLSGAWLMYVAIDSFVFESALASVENDCIFEMTVARLTES